MEIINKPITSHLSWLECAIEKHKNSNNNSCIGGNMTIEEYIEKYCGEDLGKVAEVE